MDSLLRQVQHFNNLDFSLIIVDEVHRIKNPQSKLLKALQQFKCETRFGLTVSNENWISSYS
jgi:DNA excision repair protein ERCC-6-like 2